MRRRLIPLAIVACLAATDASTAAADTTASSTADAKVQPPPHLSRQRLLVIALTAAKTDGDAHPTLIQYAEASRQLANLVGGEDVVKALNWSYLIAERGTFETPVIPSPPGIPTGPGPVRIRRSVITLVIDARTGQVTDSGMSNRYPDLARLGRVTTVRGG